MGLTVTTLKRGHLIGGMEARLCSVLFDSSYPTGGEYLSGDQIGLAAILAAINGNAGVGDGGMKFNYDTVNKKLLAYRSGPGGVQVYTQGDIKGSSTTDVGIAAGTLPTNGGLISNLADAANTTAFTIAVQPDISRNIGISFKNTNVGASTGNAVSVAIVGTFRGAAQTETISFSALELTSTAQNEVATKYGSKPFDTITSITPSAAQPANWQHAAGVGSKLGLPWDLATPAEADIIKLFKNAADLSKTGLYSSNKTVNFGTLSDGDDISVEANTAGGFVEVANGADLSATTPTLLFIG